MGQKINPTGFRLAVNRNWTSKWYANSKNYGPTLAQDIRIRDGQFFRLALVLAHAARVRNFAPGILMDRFIRQALEAEGVSVVVGARISGVQRPDQGGPVTVTVDGAGSFTGDELLVATGRRVVTAALRARAKS